MFRNINRLAAPLLSPQAKRPLANLNPMRMNGLVVYQGRLFSVQKAPAAEPTAEAFQYEIENEEEGKESTQLMTQYRLVPVNEHPLFPGSSQAVQLTKEQYETLILDKDMKVFASVLKNDSIHKKRMEIIDQMIQGHLEKDSSIMMPEIKSLEDVYETGALCDFKAVKDPNNVLMPYVLNLFPTDKAQLVSAVHAEGEVGPLSHVLAMRDFEEELMEEDLGEQEAINFKFLVNQYRKCFKIAPDDRFVQFMQVLQMKFDQQNVNSFINMILTCVSMPRYINPYKFLMDCSKHDL